MFQAYVEALNNLISALNISLISFVCSVANCDRNL